MNAAPSWVRGVYTNSGEVARCGQGPVRMSTILETGQSRMKESNLREHRQKMLSCHWTNPECLWERRESNPFGLGKSQLCDRYITLP